MDYTAQVQRWDVREIPLHIFSCFATPLVIYALVSISFGEKFLKDPKTMSVSIRQHAWQSLTGVSVWFFFSLFMKHVKQEEFSRSNLQSLWNLMVHFLISDCLFYWFHRALHMNELYFIHRQHHSHKLNENALVKLSALSGTCSHVLEIIIDGHLPVFLPCLVVSIPCSWLICFTLVTNFWVSLIHCTGTRVDMVPSLGGLLVTPNVHSKHHRRGRLNNHNFGIFLTLWDRMCGTYLA